MERLFLIDGSGYIFRAFYALPPMSRSDGTPVNAVYGFTNMLMKLVSEMKADYAVVVFDAARKNFRNEIYPEYKANRRETPLELVPQFPILREAVTAFGLPIIEKEGFEADDLIATLAQKAVLAQMEVTIISADKDLMQLINDKIKLYDPLKNKFIEQTDVVHKFGVVSDKVIDVQALAGDPSDNIPGVPNIGVKTAALLINEYGNLENLLINAHHIKQEKRRQLLIANKDLALLSKKLVTLCDHALDDLVAADFKTKIPDFEKVMTFLKKHEFKSMLVRAENWLNRFKPKSTALEFSYQLIQNEQELIKNLKSAEQKGLLAIDTETDGLNPLLAKIVGFSFAVEEDHAFYVPLAQKPLKAQTAFNFEDGPKETATSLDVHSALKILRPYLEDESILKIGHNLKFDWHVLNRYLKQLKIKPIDDTMVMSYVLDGGKNGHGLDELAKIHFNYQKIAFKDLCDKKQGIKTFAEVPLETAKNYAAEDADFTLKLWYLFKKRLLAEKMLTLYEKIERPLIAVLYAMESQGICISKERLLQLAVEFEEYIKNFETEIFKLAGIEFNVASPKQLGEILFQRLKINTGKKTAHGAWSTSAETLETLAEEGHKIADKILNWRQFSKLKTTYTDALVKQINPDTDRVHTNFAQTITTTGRLASNNPNLQNIPARNEEGRKIRQAFIVPKGSVLLTADYSQIELRLLAHVADIAAMKKAFAQGLDIHSITASEVFGVPVEGMDSLIRRKAKAINFGIIYGISPFGLAKQLGISRGEAKAYIDAYFEKFPEINIYMEKTKNFARQNGYVLTPFGRKCYLEGISHKNVNLRGFAERAAINAPIQGGAADLIKMAMIEVARELTEKDFDAQMLLQVHDELLFEVREEKAKVLACMVRAVMGGIVELSVPLEVDIGIADNWEEAH